MPRAEEFAADGDATPETTNPARRSRFSLPWRLGSSSGGTADDDMDSGLNDRLLADGDDSAAGGRGLARCGAVCRGLPARCCPGDGAAAGGKSRRPLFCGCCAALVLLLVVYGAVLYHAYAGLVASMPDLLIAPVKVSGFCDKEFVARGRVTMNNRASWAVHVTAKSSKISLSTGSADSAGPVAFSMHSDDRIGFAGGATTPLCAAVSAVQSGFHSFRRFSTSAAKASTDFTISFWQRRSSTFPFSFDFSFACAC